MKAWEDIVRDKLEGYESALPEGSLAEFHARRSATISDSGRKRFPILWALAGAAAVIAAVLFLRRPAVPENAILIIEQSAAPVAAADDSTAVSEPVQSDVMLAEAVVPKVADYLSKNQRKVDFTNGKRQAIILPESVPVSVTDGVDDTHNAQGTVEVDQPQDVNISADGTTQQVSDIPEREAVSPYIPEAPGSRPVGIKVGPAAGIVGASGLLAGLASSGLLFVKDHNYERIDDRDVCMVAEHALPLKIGVSARVPVSWQLSITSGLEYSLYTSKLQYSLSGTKHQQVDYLSVPLRLDWTFASNNWLEVYVGAGVEGSYCLGAKQDGVCIPKDGFGFTVLGAAGVQWKFTKHLGMYCEPEISWTNPSFTNPLQTYRTKHPVVYSLTSGLRYTFGK